nr:MAG TPA: hypothetical protein [Inoviridae sp.]
MRENAFCFCSWIKNTFCSSFHGFAISIKFSSLTSPIQLTQ